jgi:hypothetical protein
MRELYGGPEDGLSVSVPTGTAELRVPCSPLGVRAVYVYRDELLRFVFVGYLEAD